DAIEPGTPVYGPNGELLGPVEAINRAGIRVLNHAVPSAAITQIDGDGIHLQLAPAAFAALAPESGADDKSAEIARDAGQRLTVPLAEERLTVGTRQVQIGEVIVDKQVIEEQIMVPVMVRREEVEIIHRAPGEPREEIDDPSVIEVIRIPLRGEEPVITTRAVVTGEVVINRTARAEEKVITRTVRSTDVSVEERLNEAYAQSRTAFQEHFARRQDGLTAADSAKDRPRTFSDAEPNYRLGFRAGHDGRYAGRNFEEIEPELRASLEPAEHDPGMLDQIREEVRAGFARARTMGAH
ncbi:MAG: DUF2382 domain-containing protein, partial [Chloroflexia bacterium]